MRAQPSQTRGTGAGSLKAKFAAIFTLLTFYLLLASNAFAAGGGAERVGKNLGDLLSTVGGYVLFGVAGLIALGMLASRKFSAGDELTGIVRSTWRALAKGS